MTTRLNVHEDTPCSPLCDEHTHIPLEMHHMPITLLEQRQHMQKVNFVFDLLLQFASNPMFSGYFTAETREELKRLQS